MKKIFRRIVFDARLISHPGIGRYIRSLLEAMMRAKSDETTFVLLGSEKELLKFRKFSDVSIRKCNLPIYSLQESMLLNRYAFDADLFHVPHFNIPWITHPRLVVTLHDLIYLKVPEYRPFIGSDLFLKLTLQRISKKAKKIIAVSKATGDECAELFPAMRGKIKVIHEASDPMFFEASIGEDHLLNKYNLKKPFCLYVGSVREHKNVQGLVGAFDRLTREKMIDAELVIVGKLDQRFEKKYAFSSVVRRNPRIRHLGKVSDKVLRLLYKKAHCLVMPSFYEGFGLPVLEAMASGLPVIASNTSSLPEVTGNAALSFSPHRTDDLLAHLNSVFSDERLRRDLSLRGTQHARTFSWDKAAQETLSLYDQAVDDGRNLH